jgi:hypothetical protein
MYFSRSVVMTALLFILGAAVAAVSPLSALPPSALSNAETGAYIVRLTAPPLARLRRLGIDPVEGAAAAAEQRDRVRRDLVDRENQQRAAQGLALHAESAIITHEYQHVWRT